MYEDRFSTDWDPDALDRDEAIDRAFALGVAAECGEKHPGEYKRLVGVAGRALVQMAYDDGRSRAKDLRRDIRTEDRDPAEIVDFQDRDAEIWSKLIEYDTGEQTALQRHTKPLKRLDVPEMLRGFDLSHQAQDDLSRLRLPEFLRK